MKQLGLLFATSLLLLVSAQAQTATNGAVNAPPAPGGLKLSTMFADNMVLQRDLPVPVWGTAAPGEHVTVSFAGQKQTASADASGKWSVKLTPLTASAENRDLVVTGDHSAEPLKIANVLVGEVWYCGGQSNMEYGMMHAPDKDAVLPTANYPLFRMCRVDHNNQPEPVRDAPVKWTITTPASAAFYSAVPFYLGATLSKELNVPIGIINTSYGGTRIECWLSTEVLKNGPWTQDEKTVYALAKAANDKKVEAAKPIVEKYEADCAAARQNHQPDPPRPQGYPGDFRGPSALWNGEVAPIVGFAIRGFVWNQGENNCAPGTEETYFQMLKALAQLYRESWGQGDLPFYIMQTATHGKATDNYSQPSGYSEIRTAQLRFVQQDKNAVLVVAVDQGLLNGDVHYPQKRPVAERLAQSVLVHSYQRPGEAFGPIYDSLECKNGQAVIHFTHVGKGLLAKDGPLVDFAIAGEDKKFVPAEAKIVGNTVVVSAAGVTAPVAVRYCWADTPTATANLFNQDGFPASPFRTDTW